LKKERRRVWGLVLILVVASTFTGTIASLILYQTALREKSDFLLIEAQNLARLIGAVAKFDRQTFSDVSKATKATLSQVEDAFKSQNPVGETGEIMLGRSEDKKIVIFLRYRDHHLNQNLVLPHDKARSEAMARALAGETGVGQFPDLNGDPVLAAYTYIPYLKTGLEIKITMAEIVKPYLWSGFIIAVASGTMILFCIFLFVRVSRPVLAELEKHRMLTEAVVESAQDMIITTDEQGLIRLVNPATLEALGYSENELIARDFSVLFDPGDDTTMQTIGRIRDESFINRPDNTVYLKKKSGLLFPASITSGRKHLAENGITTIVLHDLTALKESEDTVRHLTHKMIEIKDEEQDKISRELHDTLGTNLGWLKLQAQQLIQHLPDQRAEATALITGIDETIEMARSISHSLSPIAIEKLGLVTMLERLIERAAKLTPASVTLRHENLDVEISARLSFHIFRIVQESLNNALRHSHAKNISVLCGRSRDKLSLCIDDDGEGFDTGKKASGLGLALIAERVRLLGGRLRIDSAKGQGTEVAIELAVS
jgi:PAS domain S-box-containing protein